MRLLRSLFVCGLAALACAALAVALFVTPVVVAPLPITVAALSLGLAYLVITAPSLRFKRVLRFDEIQKHFRLFRPQFHGGA